MNGEGERGQTEDRRRHQSPSAEELALLTRIVRGVARGRRLAREDAEDFEQWVHLRLIESGYQLFRGFGGRSSLSTYLNVAVARLLIDWRDVAYGRRWRPSSAAVRGGPLAVQVERLVQRDGLSAAEALEVIRTREPEVRAAQIAAIVATLPPRQPRRFVRLEDAGRMPAVSFADPIEAEEQREQARTARRRMHAALRQLPPADRQMLFARFYQGRTIRSVAASLGVEPPAMYRQVERVLRSLRRAAHEPACT